jgi:PAS domain S-box-containing protein
VRNILRTLDYTERYSAPAPASAPPAVTHELSVIAFSSARRVARGGRCHVPHFRRVGPRLRIVSAGSEWLRDQLEHRREAIKGYAASEIIGHHFSVFYPQESIERGLPALELITAERDGRFEDEGWRVRKDGSRFWANVVITPLRDGDGELIGFAKVTRDLSERRKHEESLRINEARFRALVEGVRDYAIFMLDPNGEVASWNAGARQIYGFAVHEVIGTHFSRFIPTDGGERDRAMLELEAAARDGRYQGEAWRLRSDGSRFWAHIVITSIRDNFSNIVGFSKITRDLTERRKHEAALRESEERFRLLVESLAISRSPRSMMRAM